MATPTGCFGACSGSKGATSLDMALQKHKSLLMEAKKTVVDVGKLSKEALDKAKALREANIHISHTASMPISVDYHNFVNGEIKNLYVEKVDQLIRQLESHIFDLEGLKEEKQTLTMHKHLIAARDWIDNLPDDAVPGVTTYTLQRMGQQKEVIDGTLREL